MTFDEYQALALRTAKRVDQTYDLRHAALGLASEGGEFATEVKRVTVYDKPLDASMIGGMIEELGDAMWFVSLGCAALGTTMEAVALSNIAKLRKRYPQGFSETAAEERADKAAP